jgi:hypothetical protein
MAVAMRPSLSTTACIAAMLVLSGCAATGDYPSLARRDVERIEGTALPADPDPAPPPVAANADPGLKGQLSRLVDQARTAHRDFVAARPRAQQLVGAASGAAKASEGFSVAAIALGQLDSARGRTMAALSDLDALYLSERLENYQAPTDELAAIDAARGEVAGLLSQQDSVIETLQARLGV